MDSNSNAQGNAKANVKLDKSHISIDSSEGDSVIFVDEIAFDSSEDLTAVLPLQNENRYGMDGEDDGKCYLADESDQTDSSWSIGTLPDRTEDLKLLYAGAKSVFVEQSKIVASTPNTSPQKNTEQTNNDAEKCACVDAAGVSNINDTMQIGE
ncbi:uncharacterized protein LOC116350908 isoform X2 [Contarinia nasturtii]|uniref:uncharacterized protein LOC116350908 isoform X2 n=1 Tax=Contarinia nasturtii TaxID=265458 RepID=UPI0012D43EDA|nr:uncharacterized protein LOC116350908 isoform X2 [Contarinia nasturtii]